MVGTISLQEGTDSTALLVDVSTTGSTLSICRIPNGEDTDVNATDFKVCSMMTKGAVNVP
jgi:hypothetical protein